METLLPTPAGQITVIICIYFYLLPKLRSFSAVRNRRIISKMKECSSTDSARKWLHCFNLVGIPTTVKYVNVPLYCLCCGCEYTQPFGKESCDCTQVLSRVLDHGVLESSWLSVIGVLNIVPCHIFIFKSTIPLDNLESLSNIEYDYEAAIIELGL
jgi:hypothetical protein